MSFNFRLSEQLAPRQGFTMIEVVVAAMLLVVAISFVTSLTYRIDLVWRDTRQYRLAAGELTNQLERLTSLNSVEVGPALDALEVSPAVLYSLPDATLAGELLDDAWGQRLVLRLSWQQRNGEKTVKIAGWLRQGVPAQAPGTDPAQEEN